MPPSASLRTDEVEQVRPAQRSVELGVQVEACSVSCYADRGRKGRGRKTNARHRFTGANDSVRLKNGITCCWNRAATWLVWVPG